MYFGSRTSPSAESLGSLRLFSYARVFQTFKWSWKNAVASQVIFLSGPQLGVTGGTGVATIYTPRSPNSAQGHHSADGGLRLPLMVLPSALFTLLWKPLHEPASLQTTKSRERLSLPLSLYLSINCSAFQTLLFHCPGLESEASCEMQRYLLSGTCPAPGAALLPEGSHTHGDGLLLAS